jgi:hypothetical protein
VGDSEREEGVPMSAEGEGRRPTGAAVGPERKEREREEAEVLEVWTCGRSRMRGCRSDGIG